MREAANQLLDRMTRSASTLLFQPRHHWRAPRHRSALRWAIPERTMKLVGFALFRPECFERSRRVRGGRQFLFLHMITRFTGSRERGAGVALSPCQRIPGRQFGTRRCSSGWRVCWSVEFP